MQVYDAASCVEQAAGTKVPWDYLCAMTRGSKIPMTTQSCHICSILRHTCVQFSHVRDLCSDGSWGIDNHVSAAGVWWRFCRLGIQVMHLIVCFPGTTNDDGISSEAKHDAGVLIITQCVCFIRTSSLPRFTSSMMIPTFLLISKLLPSSCMVMSRQKNHNI
jgi:hypothetical protein